MREPLLGARSIGDLALEGEVRFLREVGAGRFNLDSPKERHVGGHRNETLRPVPRGDHVGVDLEPALLAVLRPREHAEAISFAVVEVSAEARDEASGHLRTDEFERRLPERIPSVLELIDEDGVRERERAIAVGARKDADARRSHLDDRLEDLACCERLACRRERRLRSADAPSQSPREPVKRGAREHHKEEHDNEQLER